MPAAVSVSGMSDVPVWRPFRLHSVSPCRASSSSPIAQQANRQNDAPMFERERTDVAEACRLLAAEGLVIGTAGNVSAPSRRARWRSRPPAPCSASSSPSRSRSSTSTGEVVDGDLAPTSELDLHLGVYRALRRRRSRPHARADGDRALVRARRAACVHYQMLLLGGAVRVAPYATFGTPELASGRARRAGGPRRGADGEPRRDRRTAPTSTPAVELSLLLEWACTVYWRAAAIGTPRVLDAAEQRQAVVAAASSAATDHEAGRARRAR